MPDKCDVCGGTGNVRGDMANVYETCRKCGGYRRSADYRKCSRCGGYTEKGNSGVWYCRNCEDPSRWHPDF